MDRVGHADAKTTTQIYTHVTKKPKANVAEIMEITDFMPQKCPKTQKKAYCTT